MVIAPRTINNREGRVKRRGDGLERARAGTSGEGRSRKAAGAQGMTIEFFSRRRH